MYDDDATTENDAASAETAEEPGEATVDRQLLARLDQAALTKEAYELTLAALLGEQDLQEHLEGAVPHRPPEPATATTNEPARAYLSQIEVTGFRGVGPTATLELAPQPGLTIVTGRNGSGKSTFAEAAELVLTGDAHRWADRDQRWRAGWRNLHTTGARAIRIGLALDGHAGGAQVECHWEPDAELAQRHTFLQRAGERRTDPAALGWDQPMARYRPFLSYEELGDLLNGKPSEQFDALYRVLGLERLTELDKQLQEVRRAADRTRKAADADLAPLRDALAAHPDARAQQASELLASPDTADLDALEQLATTDHGDAAATILPALAALSLPDRERVAATVRQLQEAHRQIVESAGTRGEEARRIASLLQQALHHQEYHPDQPCPVCEGRTLDAQWRARTESEVARLTAEARRLAQAHDDRDTACARLRELVPPAPEILAADPGDPTCDPAPVREAWQRWDDLLQTRDPEALGAGALAAFDAVAEAVSALRTEAQQHIADRRHQWQPIADRLRTWIERTRESRLAARRHRAAQEALTFLDQAAAEIRNEALAPLAAQANETWHDLRQDSNVELGGITLAGNRNRRALKLDATVDGTPAEPLGVMSQGELHALALALFLPRATTPASPFRFLVIDDPVQSMDPAKVYRLAEVLDRVARRHQVVVFTHDDRLPNAVRHLGLEAQLRVVHRRERSQVTVDTDEKGDPALRYLADARAVAKETKVDQPLQPTSVSALLRDAVEARCHDRMLRRAVRTGASLVATERRLERGGSLRETLALLFYDDPHRGSEVNARLDRLDRSGRARRVVDAVNKGAHGNPPSGPLPALVSDAERLVALLEDVR